MSPHLLFALVFWPALAGLVVFALPAGLARIGALVVSLAELVVVSAMAFNLQPLPGWQFEDRWDWLPRLGLRWHAGVDGISGFLVLAVALMLVLAILAVPDAKERPATFSAAGGSDPVPYPLPGKAFYYGLLLFAAAMIGALVSLDLLVFYVFWELMLLPAFFLVGMWGGTRRIAATVKFALMTLVGSVTMLGAILYLGAQAAAVGARWPFDYGSALALHFTALQATLLFLAFMAAFIVKIPLFPFHVWLPGAYGEAPTAAVFLMSGVMAKLGTYGLIRFAIPLFPHVAAISAAWWSALAVIGIVYGSFLALGQGDAKQVIAYSSFSHLGWITLGLFALDSVGLTGGVYQMLSHAVATGALFLLVGMLWERRGTGAIARFGGLAHQAPIMATCFGIVALASVGLPGLNGFIGEFMILLGAWGQSPVRAILGATGVILGAAYMLWLVQRLMFGPVPSGPPIADLRPREALAVVPLVVLTVVMGLYPMPILDRIEPATNALMARVDAGAVALAQAGASTSGRAGTIVASTGLWQVPSSAAQSDDTSPRALGAASVAAGSRGGAARIVAVIAKTARVR